jgi:HSP20 family protein
MRIVRYTYPNYRSLLPSTGFLTRSPWTGLETEIDRFFQSAVGAVAPVLSGSQFPVDLYEDQANAYVRAELPGLSREAINVEVAEGVLTLTAARKQKTGDQEESFSYSRAINLPDGLQTDKISAAYENGVLTVTLPKQEVVKPKKVTVEVR